MWKFIFDYITAPLSLPFNPIADYIICLVVGEVAFRFAYSLAGEIGSTSGERKVLHWIFRLFIYAMVWAVVYAVTIAWRFVRKNRFWLMPLVIVFAGILFTFFFYRKKRKMKREKQDDGIKYAQ